MVGVTNTTWLSHQITNELNLGDLNEERSQALLSELGKDKVAFVQCDVRVWTDQLKLFKVAIQMAPSKTIDIVLANAGLNKRDEIFYQAAVADNGDPVEPDLTVLDTCLRATAYTAKLANFYFPKQPIGEGRDRCFIMTASLAAYIDMTGSPQYQAAKFGVRGMMRSLRLTAPWYGMRVNMVAPG